LNTQEVNPVSFIQAFTLEVPVKQIPTSMQHSLMQQSLAPHTLDQKTDFPESSIAGTFIATAMSMFGFLLLVILFL
jgi:hypothetical protein